MMNTIFDRVRLKSLLPVALLCYLVSFVIALSDEINAIEGRIVGGVNVVGNSAPFIVSIQHKNVHYCGGSIINPNWVLTAAHCLTSKTQVLSSTLVAGTTDIAQVASTVQKRDIKYYVVHDLYTGGTAPYDIGLVYTQTPFKWTVAVKAISLPTNNALPSGSATLYGWGSTSTTSHPLYPNILQVAQNIPIISLNTCEKVLGPKGSYVHSTNICTGPLTGGIGICTSDSGGPLVQHLSNDRTILIGVVSWGKIPCGQLNSPSVYVQVSSFIKWIADNQIVRG